MRRAGLGFLFCCLISTSVFAGFDIQDEDEIDYYGNAEFGDFKDAVVGTENITPNERAYLDSVERTSLINRGFVRFLVGRPRIKMSEIQNTTSAGVATAVPITQSNINENEYEFFLIGGYRWEVWSLDFEIFVPTELSYNANPLFATNVLPNPPFKNSNIIWNAKIQQFAALINLEMIIPRFFDFYPKRLQIHLDAGAGASFKTTNSSTYNLDSTPRQTNSQRTISTMGLLAVGARYQIYSGFLVDVDYRYLALGKTNFGTIEGVELESNKMTSAGFFLGATYMFS